MKYHFNKLWVLVNGKWIIDLLYILYNNLSNHDLFRMGSLNAIKMHQSFLKSIEHY
jgi:hypothetical protein